MALRTDMKNLLNKDQTQKYIQDRLLELGYHKDTRISPKTADILEHKLKQIIDLHILDYSDIK